MKFQSSVLGRSEQFDEQTTRAIGFAGSQQYGIQSIFKKLLEADLIRKIPNV